MDVSNIKTRLDSYSKNYIRYNSEYNGFWRWKIKVEEDGSKNILDDNHRDETYKRLLEILPGWQTYRGVECDYKTSLPVSLNNIAEAYDHIRNYSLLDLNEMNNEHLELIWHELGRVKTDSGIRRKEGDYHVISVCKPLMFIWGQTPAFDSRNRKEMMMDSSLLFTAALPRRARWQIQEWRMALEDLRKAWSKDEELINCLRDEAIRIFGSDHVIPYGRFLDIFYF